MTDELHSPWMNEGDVRIPRGGDVTDEWPTLTDEIRRRKTPTWREDGADE